jgi:hypothetical protein
MTNRAILAIILSILLLGSGCIGYQPAGHSAGPGPGGTSGGAYPVASTVPALATKSPPSVIILDPPFDGGIPTGNVTISVRVTNFTIIPQNYDNPGGTGHLIYYRDVVPPATGGIPALTLPGTYAISHNTSHEWHGIAPGTHTFAVQLVNNDDTPLDPPVLDAVDITAVLPGMVSSPGQGMDLF